MTTLKVGTREHTWEYGGLWYVHASVLASAREAA